MTAAVIAVVAAVVLFIVAVPPLLICSALGVACGATRLLIR